MSTIASAALQALYLFSPLLFAAATSAVVLRFDWLKGLKGPLDCGLMFRGRRLFGDHKTWRGLVVTLAACVVWVTAQRLVARDVAPSLQLLDYSTAHPVGLGGAMALGAIIGELPNSFVKRQVGIPPGQTRRGWSSVVFYVWDQVDLLIGAWPLLMPWIRPSAQLVLTSFAVALGLHPLVALTGYLLGARATAR